MLFLVSCAYVGVYCLVDRNIPRVVHERLTAFLKSGLIRDCERRA